MQIISNLIKISGGLVILILLILVGEWIYVESEFYLSHGEDDFVGGRARVMQVKLDEKLRAWVEFEVQSGKMHNWEYLGPKQNPLRARYGKAMAHRDPDRRPEFNRLN